MKRRVVITGCGVISPIGLNVDEFWTNLLQGKSGIGPIQRFDPANLPVQFAAEVHGFNPEHWISKKDLRRMDYFTQYAVVAALEAVENAQLSIEKEDPYRVGVLVGSGNGGFHFIQDNHKVLLEKGAKRVSPYLASGMLINATSGEIAIRLGAKGPSGAVVTACATGSSCIGEAMRMIQYGTVDVMIAGGTEDAITPLDIASFAKIQALSTWNDRPHEASRPFDKDRNGFVIGSGAGVVVLEELEHARKRGATILAELVGYGANTDAYHITSPNPTGETQAQAIRAALEDANVRPDEVHYINAHGTSTVYNDRIEALAIERVFEENTSEIPVSSIKSMTGHMLGGAGAVELIATIYSIRHQVVPPNVNLNHPDEDIHIRLVGNQPESHFIQVAISNSFGFGGHNVCLVTKAYEEACEV